MTSFRPASPALLGSLLVIAAAGMSGALGPLLGLLYDRGLTPLAFAAWRGVIAGAALWLVLVWRRRRDPTASIVPRGLPRRERLALVGFTVSNVALNTSVYVAFDRIPIAVALLVFYTYPVLLAVYGRVTGTERLGPTKATALVLALSGLVLVVSVNFDATAGASMDPLGLALAVVASISGAAWVIFGRACPSVSAEQAMGTALAASIVVVGGAVLVTSGPAPLTFPLGQPDLFAGMVVLALLSGAAAAPLFTIGMRLISRVRAGILALIEPILGAVAAALILGQVLAPVQVLGGAFVLVAALLIQRDREDAPVGDTEGMLDEEIAAPGVA